MGQLQSLVEQQLQQQRQHYDRLLAQQQAQLQEQRQHHDQLLARQQAQQQAQQQELLQEQRQHYDRLLAQQAQLQEQLQEQRQQNDRLQEQLHQLLVDQQRQQQLQQQILRQLENELQSKTAQVTAQLEREQDERRRSEQQSAYIAKTLGAEREAALRDRDAVLREQEAVRRRFEESRLEAQERIRELQQALDSLSGVVDASWQISSDEISVEAELGRGAFATVLRGRWNGLVVALKRFDQENLHSPHYVREWRNELRVNARARHANIVQFLGACVVQGSYPLVVMEFLPASLREVVAAAVEAARLQTAAAAAAPAPEDAGRALTLLEQMDILTDVARGLAYLHNNNITHGDVSDANILVTVDMTAKIGDLGEARMMQRDHAALNPLNTDFSAPERSGQQVDAYRADVFSAGMVILFVGTTRPVDRVNRLHQLVDAAEGPLKIVPESVRRLSIDCVAEAPASRPGRMQDVLLRLLDIGRECEADVRQCPARRRVVRGESGTVSLVDA